jgi:serine/threonine-protein kinase
LPPDVKLPILPQAISEFTEKAADPNANAKELAKIVESDAGLTCELLRTVNSAATGLRCRVSSVGQAMNLLGIRNAGLLLTTTALKSAMSSRKSKLINFQLFWNTNYERALFARDLAETMNTDKELAFAGTMLQDFLLPLLTSEMVDSYVGFADLARSESLNLSSFEQQLWGWDHALAAGQIMVSWKFPDDLACCVLHHHAGLEILSDKLLGRTAVSAVAIAGLLPDFFQQVPDGLDRLIKLDSVWPAFRLADRLERVAGQFQEARLAGSSQHLTFLKRLEKKMAAAV